MSKNKIFILLLFIIFNIFGLNIYANNNENTESLQKANQLYSEKSYEQAIIIYSKILESDYESAALYYNLANSYYRLNELSQSIYYYEKAKMLAPDDEDIKYNSKIAELMVYNKPTPIPQIGIVKFYDNFINSQNINTWSWLSLALFALAISFAVWFVIAKTSRTKKISFTFGAISLYKVTIADDSGEWYKIILEDGKQGWIAKDELRIL